MARQGLWLLLLPLPSLTRFKALKLQRSVHLTLLLLVLMLLLPTAVVDGGAIAIAVAVVVVVVATCVIHGPGFQPSEQQCESFSRVCCVRRSYVA